MPPHHIGVLGGGITGLSAAFHLSRRFPSANITLVEQSQRLGGWVRSERVQVKDSDGSLASILLETGPRTLRPNSLALLELINTLDLQRSVITTPKTAAAARHRFILDPSQSTSIQSIPTGPISALSSTLGVSLITAFFTDIYRLGNRPEGVTDESVDSFLTRRFGRDFARKFGSALVHGVYATDSRDLSVRAAFPTLWAGEDESKSSVLGGMFVKSVNKDKSIVLERETGYNMGNVKDDMKGVSVYSFKDGLSTLVRAIEAQLRENDKVRILTDTAVRQIAAEGEGFQLELSSGTSELPFTHLVSTIAPSTLQKVLPPTHSLPHLTANPSSSVTVLNLVFATPKGSKSLHPAGFGYLTSRPQDDYYQFEGPGILGTVFDSCSLASQDTDSSGLTKMTVMLGGPFHSPSEVYVPNVLAAVASHLGIAQADFPEPLGYWINVQRNCIPTYKPGHLERMEELRSALESQPWNGKLAVIGAGVSGVSLGDCVEAGRNVGNDWEIS